MHKKLMFLQLYLPYCYLIMQILFIIYKNWTFIFKIGLPNYPDSNLLGDLKIKVISVFHPLEPD